MNLVVVVVVVAVCWLVGWLWPVAVAGDSALLISYDDEIDYYLLLLL